MKNVLIILSLSVFLQKSLSKDCACGKINGGRRSSKRIVNGEEVNPPHKYPWMVSLSPAGCGGSLISSRHVLTAAHCADDSASMSVTLGLHDKTKPNILSETVKVLSKHIHRDWGDIAILTLATPVKFNKIISPVCLPAGGKTTYLGRKATVAGWGLMADPGRYPNKLQEVDLQTNKCPPNAFGTKINSKYAQSKRL